MTGMFGDSLPMRVVHSQRIVALGPPSEYSCYYVDGHRWKWLHCPIKSSMIIVESIRYFYSPNVISPNGDNNKMIIWNSRRVWDVQQIEFVAFDRWGGRLYSIQNPEINNGIVRHLGWTLTWRDGLNPGVHVYQGESSFPGYTLVYRKDLNGDVTHIWTYRIRKKLPFVLYSWLCGIQDDRRRKFLSSVLWFKCSVPLTLGDLRKDNPTITIQNTKALKTFNQIWIAIKPIVQLIAI